MSSNYGVNEIHQLKGLDAVKKRPGMYVGSTSQSGIDQLVYEIIDNSIDEFVAGYGKKITIHIKKDCSVTVIDEGRGIPVGLSDEFKDEQGNPIDTLTGILTNLHAGGKFGDGGYKCFTSDMLVNTENGNIKISDVCENDKVYNSNNILSKVNKKFEYDYNGDVNCVSLENGKVIKAINGHYILVSTDENKLLWKKIEEIKETDSLVELDESDDIEFLKKTIPVYNYKKY